MHKRISRLRCRRGYLRPRDATYLSRQAMSRFGAIRLMPNPVPFFSERASDKKGTCFFAGYHTEADSVRIHSVKCRGAFGGYQYYILDIFTIIQINSASAGADPLRNGTRSRQHFPSRTLPLPHYRARHVQAPVSAAFTILPCPPTRTEIFPFSLPSIPSMYPSRLFCRHSLSFPRADGFIRPQPAKKALHEG